MPTVIDIEPQSERELVICRLMDAPPEALYRVWTDPVRYGEWFCPKPWTAKAIELDVRPGGRCHVAMSGPEGETHDMPGVYLEVVPNRKLVFTDAFTEAWAPSAKPFMTGSVEFEDAGNGKTRYTARARHWTDEDCKAHAEMGFHEGWGKVAEQLEAAAQSLVGAR